ncbi:hypothetical protein GCM10023322_35280 [Rugosimonospora acidiphila]|uniref:Integral membrane protein n=1 Tax=Rugosimonospora acidiphila TaxID=556531 RepID=A0ABP9RVF9_9ACTN
MAGATEFVLRFAADRWVAAGRPDPFEEWAGELAVLRAEGGGGTSLRCLLFAASLAVSRVPRRRSPSASGWLPGWGRLAVPVLILLFLPAVGTLVGVAELRLPDMLVVTSDPSDPYFWLAFLASGLRIVVLAGLAVLFAVVGRVVGRRLPLSTVSGDKYRVTVTAVVTPVLAAVGMAAELILTRPQAGAAAIAGGLVLWVALTALTVPAVLRPLRAGHWWRAGVRAILAALLTADACVTLVALPRILPLPGGARSIPWWFPGLLLDGQHLITLGPSYRHLPLAQELDITVSPLPLMLIVAAAYSLGYALAAARSRSLMPNPGPTAGVAAATSAPPTRDAGWFFAAFGGLTWLALVTGMTPLADRLTAVNKGGDDVLLREVFELRRLAVLLTCGGLIVALRRVGPAWPAVLTVPALLVADAILNRNTLSTWKATAAVLLSLALCAVVTAGATRLLARPDRRYGRWTATVVAIAGAYCAAGPVEMSDSTMHTPTALVPLTVALGAGIGALATHCIGLARTPRPTRLSRVALTTLGAVPFGAAGLLTARAADWYQIPGLLGPFAAVLAALLTYPGQRSRKTRTWLLLAALPAAPMLGLIEVALSLVADALAPPRPGLSDDAPPIVIGSLLVAVALAAVLPAVFKRPNASVPATPAPFPHPRPTSGSVSAPATRTEATRPG